ncbi:helix-turn-helix transcriptional regulator [Bradyrhizobium sp. WSM3983]|uniref:helix-turn-helix domain-containing protein n=1 Tax=Bradyrhizobium sp. WSM3983 TaxID=1038867 RepID=UPI00055AC6C5|nr:helix-turn-helix transcriptional regulator [Bradyrhizobium sp. WSM3983]
MVLYRQSKLVIARQVKAARSLLGWQQSRLAEASQVAISTIRRIEVLNGAISARKRTVSKLAKALEDAGIEFIGAPGPGVKLCAEPHEVHSIESRGVQRIA